MKSKAATAVAYLIFAATGLGVVLPGTLLSSLLTRWSLTDVRAGFLFFLFFIGSSCGALLSRGRLARSVARGCAATAMGAWLLAVASRGAAFAAMLILGLGLGIAMTSVSLLQSRLQPTMRAAQMARLNLTWALGASVGPALLLRGTAHWTLQAVLYATAITFGLFTVLALWILPSPEAPAATVDPSSRMKLGAIPLILLALVPLATGIESSVGGWLAAYSKRDGLLLNQTISTVTCFWAGLLISRLIQSHPAVARRASDGMTLRLAPWLMSAGLLLLLLGHGGWSMPAGAMLLGCGVGPTYPLLLALLLNYGEAGNIIFLAAGLGGSAFPLFTGLVSGWTGSLAVGLTVPLAAAAAMGVIAIIAVRPTAVAAAPGSSG